MMWRDGTVLRLLRTWGSPPLRCALVEAEISAAPPGARGLLPGERVRALAYEAVTGLPGTGERLRLEVSALDRALGTGGHAMVSSRPDVLPPDSPPQGHLVKARYMPDQVMVTGVDEQGTTHHRLLSSPVGTLTLEGMPVVVADLHSSLPAVLAGLRSPGSTAQDADAPAAPAPELEAPARVVYVMTDGGALPLPYSRTVPALVEAGWLVGTVTVGQAWGGQVEAVSIHNALLAARHVLGADVTVVTQGPGNLGTDTPWGFSGTACGEVVNAAAVLGGHPVACLRVSQSDPRQRHRGVSHHSMTAYGKVALAAADVVVPRLEGSLGAQVLDQARVLATPRAGARTHHLVQVATDGLVAALHHAQQETGTTLSTMGRGLEEDEAAFVAAAAAGRHVRDLLTRREAGA